ncbi:hypothetical protein ABZ743_30110 [Streptomyces sp. NPDC006662]|uniref:hypothetical protein n=1 Tax=Streptomyces sp. NPDC006662 TaxID=3156902 RepID=UPI00340A0FA5
MSLSLLNHCNTFTLAVVAVGGTVLAVGGSALLRRRRPSPAGGEHNDMVGVTLGMFGAIYGIILAFRDRHPVDATGRHSPRRRPQPH